MEVHDDNTVDSSQYELLPSLPKGVKLSTTDGLDKEQYPSIH
jgi:hypothetical protein